MLKGGMALEGEVYQASMVQYYWTGCILSICGFSSLVVSLEPYAFGY
jgi:hypothetical protein